METYRSWQFDLPTIPERSRLYGLQPIGIGTAEVESLTSYLARLAAAHCVHPSTLIHQEIEPLLKQRLDFAVRFETPSVSGPDSPNGKGQKARKYVLALEALTGQSNLYCSTLLLLNGLHANRGLLNPVRAWCPLCYQQWQASGQPFYDPLLWMFRDVTVCQHHHSLLHTHCPQCQYSQHQLTRIYRPGYCSKCHQWLGASVIACDNGGIVIEPDVDWRIWVSTSLAAVLAVAPQMPQQFGDPQVLGQTIAANMFCYLSELTPEQQAQFIARTRAHQKLLTGQCHPQKVPELTSLLTFSYFAGMSLLNLMTNP